LLLYVAELAGTTARCMMGGKEERWRLLREFRIQV
jgi:hypothetical protein